MANSSKIRFLGSLRMRQENELVGHVPDSNLPTLKLAQLDTVDWATWPYLTGSRPDRTAVIVRVFKAVVRSGSDPPRPARYKRRGSYGERTLMPLMKGVFAIS
ncbi:UNVERIFIED_CONTAM: hypothetical protein Sindi_0250300 [Sesamum indicum]